MKNDLEHLPQRKREELGRVIKILFDEFDDALAGKNAPHRKAGKILKIILFGSYARGDWVDDPDGGYYSDFDILVVVNHDELTEIVDYWAEADAHLLREQTISRRIATPVNFIVHSLADVNCKLKKGRPFFVDIVREGSLLFEIPNHPFDRPGKLSPETARAEAQAYFDEWFPSTERRFELAQEAIRRGFNNEAAFDLHQVTERLYHCVLLVLTLYSPKSHKLNFLRSQCEQHDMRLIAAWPRDSKFAQRCFELLRGAYVNARYSPHYRISSEELDWLSARIAHLQALVKLICEERLAGG